MLSSNTAILKRVVIVGCAGAGKTALAAELAARLGVPMSSATLSVSSAATSTAPPLQRLRRLKRGSSTEHRRWLASVGDRQTRATP